MCCVPIVHVLHHVPRVHSPYLGPHGLAALAAAATREARGAAGKEEARHTQAKDGELPHQVGHVLRSLAVTEEK